MRSSKACGKYQKKSFRSGQAALCLLPVMLGFYAPGAQKVCAQSVRAPTSAIAREQVRESDLRAFCPPAEFAEGAYAYKIYGKDGSLSHQAAIANITRDCRFDNGRDLMQMHIAAAGRIVPGQAALRGVLTLPIEVKIMRGSKVLLARIYRQKVSVGRGASQFLLSEWVGVKKSEAAKGAKIFIGFAKDNARPKQQKAAVFTAAKQPVPAAEQAKPASGSKKTEAKPFADRLSPNAGALTIPESF